MNEMNEVVKVNPLPEKYYADWYIKDCIIGKDYHKVPYKHDISIEISKHCPNYVKNDFGYDSNIYSIISEKLDMIGFVRDFFTKHGMAFDEFNGLGPTRISMYMAYEFSTLWLWAFMCNIIVNPDEYVNKLTETFYNKYSDVISSVFKKYPNYTGFLIQELDLRVPGNKFFDYAKMDEANWDSDSTTDYQTDSKAEDFKKWVITETSLATEKDKMRVNNWFVTKKSHKQILAEINKVSGNYDKYNCRLALFVERLFNKEGLDYFFEKTGFNSKEELFMTYFEKLTMFDDETKKSFIKKYLIG